MPNTNLTAKIALAPVPAGSPAPSEPTIEYVNLREVFRLDESLIVRITGDSMAPKINDGDFCIVNCCRPPEPGNTVVYCTGENEFTVKQYKNDERNGLRLVPANPEYAEIRPNEGQFVGVVSWIFSKTASFCGMMT